MIGATLPPEWFYWAVIDERCPRRLTGRQRARLGYAFESVLPAPVESVHAVYIPAGERTIACAIDREELGQIRAEGVLTLYADSAPDFIANLGPRPPNRLNFLTGAFEPPALARRRRRRAAEAIAALLLVTNLLAVGMQHRINTARASAAAADRSRLVMLADILPPAPGAGGSQSPELRLIAELRRLQRTREAPAGDLAPPPDATAPLADLLAAWPGELHLRTRQLRATPTEIQLQVAIDAIEDADALAALLARAPGWQPRLPQVGQERSGGYLASITLVAAAGRQDQSEQAEQAAAREQR